MISTDSMSVIYPSRSHLRQAQYVKVCDLISPYKIASNRLEEELTRVHRRTEKPLDEIDTSIGNRRLQPPRGGFNLCLRVSEIDVVFCKTRVDGTQVRLAEILVGDESGCVSLRARDQQIDLLKAVSGRQGAIVARNATIELYQGRYIRLVVTKWGKLSEYPDAISSTPKPPQMTAIDRNYSLIDLSRLAMNDSESPTGTGRRTSGYQYPASQETRLSNSRRHAQASRLVNVAPENQFQPMLQYNSAYMSAPQYAYSYSDQDRHQLLMAQQYGFQQQHMQHQQSSQANTNIHATARMGFNQAGNSFFFAHQSRIPQQTRPSTPPNTESLVLTPQTPQMNPSAATFSPQSSQDGERRP